jgi:hypothetical protein
VLGGEGGVDGLGGSGIPRKRYIAQGGASRKRLCAANCMEIAPPLVLRIIVNVRITLIKSLKNLFSVYVHSAISGLIPRHKLVCALAALRLIDYFPEKFFNRQ